MDLSPLNTEYNIYLFVSFLKGLYSIVLFHLRQSCYFTPRVKFNFVNFERSQFFSSLSWPYLSQIQRSRSPIALLPDPINASDRAINHSCTV